MSDDDQKCEFINFELETPEELDKKYPNEIIRKQWTKLEAMEQDIGHKQLLDLSMNKTFLFADNGIMGSRYGRECIARALALLPSEVINYAADKVVYVVSPQNVGMCIPPTVTSGRKVIIIDSFIFARDAKPMLFKSHVNDILYVILHELAHCWLEHEGPDNVWTLDEELDYEWRIVTAQQEKEANQQVLEWIKGYDIYTEFRNKLVHEQL